VFSAQPRESHKTAFRNPAHWLHCTCCTKTSDHDSTRATQPTTSILHELYLESTTKLINIYDWFTAFSEVKQNGPEDLSEEQLLASFMASLDELVWMGYVKRTQRKTDHVEKLVGA
jgi:origin recognition complex subunit 3